MFNYSFPAVKGIQAKSEYYISMVPCKLLKKLFVKDNNDVLPECRAQRKLNYDRIPEIRDYILKNRDSYVFSALAASIDGQFEFVEIKNGVGMLEVDMDSIFMINDGQHRNAAIQEAIEEDESIGNETIPVVFFADKGLKRSQQMFTDLNKYAVKPSKSQNTFYDYKDARSSLCREIIEQNSFLRDYTDVEKDNLGKNSAKIFTLNAFLQANNNVLGQANVNEESKKFCMDFWNSIVSNIKEWHLMEQKNITKQTLREEYIITQKIILYAFGKLGNYFMNNTNLDMDKYLVRLNGINWLRTNKQWNGNVIVDGKISFKDKNITLTYLKIKELIGLNILDNEKTKRN